MNKLYALGAITFIIGLLITIVTWLLYVVGWISISKVLVVIWGLMAMTVFFESALDLTIKYLNNKEDVKSEN